MKKFSKHWIGSKKKKKQNKYRANASKHTRNKIIRINLTKELRQKYKIRNFSPRKDDVVRVMSGSFKKKEGKITKIDTRNYKIYVEGLNVSRKEGTKVQVPIDPSNLQLKDLKLEDKKRISKLNKE